MTSLGDEELIKRISPRKKRRNGSLGEQSCLQRKIAKRFGTKDCRKIHFHAKYFRKRLS